MAKKPRNLVQKKWLIWHKNFTGKIWTRRRSTRRKSVIRVVNFKFWKNSIFDPFSIWRPKNVSVTSHGKNPISIRQRSSSAARLHKKNENSKFRFFPKLRHGKVSPMCQKCQKWKSVNFQRIWSNDPSFWSPRREKIFGEKITPLRCSSAKLQRLKVGFASLTFAFNRNAIRKWSKLNKICRATARSIRHATPRWT